MDRREFLKSDPGRLRQFGLSFGAVFTLIAAYLFFRHHPFAVPVAGVAVLFAAIGLIRPTALRPLYIPWMTFAYYLSQVMSTIILTLVFFLVITPVGSAMRLAGKDILDLGFPTKKKSYWLPAEKYPDDLERYSKPY